MSENFTPLLPYYDWNEEWQQLQKHRRRADDAQYWDKRAQSFTVKDAPNQYVREFITRAALKEGETVFDMGCGTGALSLPLGAAGHPVIAGDFSQGMLDLLKKEVRLRGLTNVTPNLMSWEDNWESHGLYPGCVDVALASRSIATTDLKDSLLRLTNVAKRRACITLTTGTSPRVDGRLAHALGVNALGHDYHYALTILINEGIKPEVSYIQSIRHDTYDSCDEAYEDLSHIVHEITRRQLTDIKEDLLLNRLRAWLDTHLIENPSQGKEMMKGVSQKRLCLDKPRSNTWAFIAWDTEQEADQELQQ